MATADCTEKIKVIIADKLGLDEHILSARTRFSDDLDVDSLDLTEIIWEVEKSFKISIPDEEAEKITTVGELAYYIKERI